MPDYVTMREYAELHGVQMEALKARVKRKQIPFIRVGKSVMIDKSTPWEERKRTGRIPKAVKEKSKAESRKLKITITRAYYVAVEDHTGKELVSDFTFLTKAEAQKIGERMKKEVEGNNGNR